MIQPTFEGEAFAQKGGNKYLGGYKNTYDRKFWKTKKCFKFDKEATHIIIVQKAILKTARKIKAMTIIPDLVDPVNQASMILVS